MKKTIKRDNIKKIALTVLILIVFNIISPISSYAGITAWAANAILSKPLATISMAILDSIDIAISTTFMSDEIYRQTQVSANEQGYIWDDGSLNFWEKIHKGINEAGHWATSILISPEDVFSGKVQIADANIFSDDYSENGTVDPSDVNVANHLLKTLKKAVAGIYNITRNLAVLILLCLLIYCGIRIVLSVNSSEEKAKWKMYLMDWVKALALVMFIHVIMVGVFYLAETISEILISNGLTGGKSLIRIIREGFWETNGKDILDFSSCWIYIIMYGYCIMLTIVFIIAYFKRLMHLVVLIVLAPIISALYALGKTTKQSFGTWMKEFVMGVMIQPYHVLIYTVLLGIPLSIMDGSISVNGFELFKDPTIQMYALFSIAMIRPIEKYTRRLFGFNQTTLDNVASFESGKKTIDAGIQATMKVVETAAKIGTVVATGGATAGTLGASTTTSAASATASSSASATTSGATSALGGLPGGGMPGGSFPGGGGVLDPGVEDALDIHNGFMPDVDEEEFLNSPPEWSAPDTSTIGGYLDQFGSYDNYNDLAQEQGYEDLSSFLEDAGFDQDEISKYLGGEPERSTALSSNQNGGNIGLNNANVSINQAGQMDVNSLGEINSSNGADEEKNEEKDEEKDDRIEIQGNDLANGLRERLGDIVGRLTSPDMIDQYQGLRESLHGFTDSLYAPGVPVDGDWKNSVDITNKLLKQDEVKAQLVNNFVNDENNQKRAIELYGLKDIKNKDGKDITATEQAKEKLKGMSNYVTTGITDVDQIYQLEKYGQDNPFANMQAMRLDKKQEKKENLRVQNFVKNENNIKQMQNIVADKMGIAPEERNNITIQQKQEINQVVNQAIKDGQKYISSGVAKDSKDLDRLLSLEKKIDKKFNVKGNKTDFVVNANKMIEGALKKKTGKIDAPNKQLEKFLNDELKERRKQSK